MAHRAFKPEFFDRMVRKAKGAPVPFAFAVDKADTPVFVLDEDLEPKALFAKVKSETGASRGAWGLATVLGSGWELRCEKWVSGMAKSLKALAKERGWAAKTFALLDAAGKAIGEDGAPPAPPIGSPPAPASPPAHPKADAEAGPAADIKTRNLTVRDPKELFTPDYMDGLVGLKMKGANSPDLKEVMRELEKGVSGDRRKELIAQLARIRGGDAAKLEKDYEKFLQLRDQQNAVRKSKAGMDAVPSLAEDIHGEFMGSNPQLVYGKVVGDAFGIDPVFGALLNPTGGMVGPGNMALHMDDDDPTGYHGIVHDAAGYLYNYHDQGPGYNYLGTESRDTSDPLTGQQSGMRYWHEKLDPGVKTQAMMGVIDLVYVVKDGKVLETAKKALENAGRAAEDLARAAAAEAEAKARAAQDAAAAKAAEVARKAREAAEEKMRQAAAVVNAAKIVAEKATQAARDTVTHAVDQALATGKKTATAAGAAAQEIVDSVSTAAKAAEQAAVETATSAASAIGQATTAAASKVEAAWNYLWS